MWVGGRKGPGILGTGKIKRINKTPNRHASEFFQPNYLIFVQLSFGLGNSPKSSCFSPLYAVFLFFSFLAVGKLFFAGVEKNHFTVYISLTCKSSLFCSESYSFTIVYFYRSSFLWNSQPTANSQGSSFIINHVL